MTRAVVYALIFLAGFLTKITDNIADENTGPEKLRYATGIGYGSVVGYLLSLGSGLSTVIIAVVAGNLVFGRVDDRAHQTALAGMFLVASVLGIYPPNLLFLAFLGISAWTDEFLNEEADKRSGQKSGLWAIARQRVVLELTALAMSLYSGNAVYFMAVLLFDLSYHIAHKISKRGMSAFHAGSEYE